MESIHNTKWNNSPVMAWLAIFLIVGIILLSGCAGNHRIYHGEALDESRNLRGTVVTANYRGASIPQVSFIEHIWENIWNGMNDRIRKMTGRPT